MINILLMLAAGAIFVFAGFVYPLYTIAFTVLLVLFLPNLGWAMRERFVAGVVFFVLCLGLQAMLEGLWISPRVAFDDVVVWLDGIGLSWLTAFLLSVSRMALPWGFPDDPGDFSAYFWILAIFNFVLFAIYVAAIRPLVWVLKLLARAVRWLIRRPGDLAAGPVRNDETGGLAGWLAEQRLGAQRLIYIWCGAISILLFGLLPFWITWLGQSEDFSKHASVLWIGPLILVLEGMRNALHTPDEGLLDRIQRMLKRAPAVQHSLRPAYERFATAYHGPALPFEIAAVDPPAPRKVDQPAPQGSTHSADSETLWREVRTKRDDIRKEGKELNAITVMETLTRAHFDLMTRLLQDRVFDAGGSAWIICPDHSVEECEQHFRSASIATGTRFLQNWQSLRRARSETRTVHVLIGSIEDFDRELTEERSAFKDNLNRLSAVFILQLDQIDTGLLKIMGARMRARAESFREQSDNLLLFVQSERQDQTGDRVGQLFLAIEDPGTSIIMNPLQDDQHMHRYFVLWQHDADLSKLLKKNISNADSLNRAMPSVMVETWLVNPEYDCYVADPDGRFHSDYWNNKLAGDMRADRIGDRSLAKGLPQRFGALRPFQTVPPICQTPVAFVEDHGNLATALGLGVRGYRVPEMLTHVVQTNYPFANMMRARVEAEAALGSADGSDNFRIRRTLSAGYSAIAPKPTGGVTELALIIASELKAHGQSGGVPQSRIAACFDLVQLEGHIAKPLGIGQSRTGLARLFELVFGKRPTIAASRSENYEYHYRVDGGTVPTGLRFISLVSPIQSQARRDEAILPAADYGLSFDQNTLLRRRGVQYRITSVDLDQGRAVEQVENDATEVDRRFVFRRGHALAGLSRLSVATTPASLPGAAIEDPLTSLIQSNFAVERSRVHTVPAGACEMNLVHIVAERRTFQSRALPLFRTEAPLDEAAPMAAAGHSDRLLRAGLHLRILQRGAGGEADERTRRLALTLATTLQDTLALLFPRHAHRIAVLSPQMLGLSAEIRDRREDGNQDDAAEFALFRQPFLSVASDDERQRIVPDETLVTGTLHAYRTLFRLISARAEEVRNEGTAASAQTAPLVDLLMIEDSDHDLGVARAAFDSFDREVRAPWLELLTHLAETRQPGREYYAFGKGQFPDVYDFEAARAVAAATWAPAGGGQ